MDQEFVSATLTIAMPAATVFAVLADPATHAAIDGTGWVQEAVDRAPLTEVGQIFEMDMYHTGHPDGDYQTVNKRPNRFGTKTSARNTASITKPRDARRCSV